MLCSCSESLWIAIASSFRSNCVIRCLRCGHTLLVEFVVALLLSSVSMFSRRYSALGLVCARFSAFKLFTISASLFSFLFWSFRRNRFLCGRFALRFTRDRSSFKPSSSAAKLRRFKYSTSSSSRDALNVIRLRFNSLASSSFASFGFKPKLNDAVFTVCTVGWLGSAFALWCWRNASKNRRPAIVSSKIGSSFGGASLLKCKWNR